MTQGFFFKFQDQNQRGAEARIGLHPREQAQQGEVCTLPPCCDWLFGFWADLTSSPQQRWSVCPGKDKFGGFPRIVPLGQALPLQNVTAWHAPLGWPFLPHPLLARRQESQSVVAAWEMNFCPTQMVTSRQQGPHSWRVSLQLPPHPSHSCQLHT